MWIYGLYFHSIFYKRFHLNFVSPIWFITALLLVAISNNQFMNQLCKASWCWYEPYILIQGPPVEALFTHLNKFVNLQQQKCKTHFLLSFSLRKIIYKDWISCSVLVWVLSEDTSFPIKSVLIYQHLHQTFSSICSTLWPKHSLISSKDFISRMEMSQSQR